MGNISESKGWVVKCKTCDKVIVGGLYSAMNAKSIIVAAKYVATENVILEDVYDLSLVEYRSELNKCCEKRCIKVD